MDVVQHKRYTSEIHNAKHGKNTEQQQHNLMTREIKQAHGNCREQPPLYSCNSSRYIVRTFIQQTQKSLTSHCKTDEIPRGGEGGGIR